MSDSNSGVETAAFCCVLGGVVTTLVTGSLWIWIPLIPSIVGGLMVADYIDKNY